MITKIKDSVFNPKDENKVLFENFRELVLQKMIEINGHCFINFGVIRRNDNSTIIGYGKCFHKHIHENDFKFTVSEAFNLSLSKLSICCTDAISYDKKAQTKYRQLRGQRRKNVQKDLKHLNPKKVQIESVNDFKTYLAEDSGNMQEFCKLNVLQKAISEALACFFHFPTVSS